MRDSWGAYVLSAWGQDELMPVTGQGTRAFCDTGARLQLTTAATATRSATCLQAPDSNLPLAAQASCTTSLLKQL